MTDTIASLGPLERIDGRWVLGDARRPDGFRVEFREDGLYQHERSGEGLLIPWSRIMLGVRLTLGAKYPHKGHGFGLRDCLPGPWKGHGSGYLHMTLRHPYEDFILRFTTHPHRYRATDVLLLEALLTHAVQEGEVHRLAAQDRLSRMVAQLVPLKARTPGALSRAVAGAWEAG
ncbi:hypothetical protein ABZ865_27275 [Streptomyces sp. NPDC047085]|uniref:hypothetical protein n=1 Tax=Streptomyces sp. NPDC047085 TaxID=3155140 RepID=UPI0033C0E3BD